MARIRHIDITHFRVIERFTWCPAPGFNAIVGPGDSGKSSVLDAIFFALSDRYTGFNTPFKDSDFYRMDTKTPITIKITLGDISDEFKNLEDLGHYIRGFNNTEKTINDEPQLGDEKVITIALTVDSDLDPQWTFYSERAEQQGIEKPIKKGFELNYSNSTGGSSGQGHDLGKQVIVVELLNESQDKNMNKEVKKVFTAINRSVREGVGNNPDIPLNSVINQVETVAERLGVNVSGLQALLDLDGRTLQQGALGLHDEHNTPLRKLGTGSSRLLAAGLQQLGNTSNIFVVDEIEHGLEPYRISRILNALGSKENPPKQQVFATTHSPYVLRELSIEQLWILRREMAIPFEPTDKYKSHVMYSAEYLDYGQATLRIGAEAFFNRKVLVCEGKTEVGLIRGIDLNRIESGHHSLQSYSVFFVNGSGDSMFKQAAVFNALGYDTAIFKDSDLNTQKAHKQKHQAAIDSGVKIFEWGNNMAFEQALFSFCPDESIEPLLALAYEKKGEQAVWDHIKLVAGDQDSLNDYLYHINPARRMALGNAAKKYEWFKDIEPGERVGHDIYDHAAFDPCFSKVVAQIIQWATSEAKADGEHA